ncbi:MAG: FMN-binding protein [Candidatus Saccharimonadales bacterium]
MLETYEQNSKKKLVATVLAVVVIAGVVILADALKSKSSTADVASQATSQTTASNTPETSTSASDTTATSTTASGSYKDGTYSASSDYYVPHGDESIKVSLTLSSGTITNVSIDNSENDGNSAAYQEEFASVYKSYVVGKKISSLQLSNIAGASDTTQGFNEALSKITSEAQA